MLRKYHATLQNAEVNVYNLWRKMLDEQEKIAKTRLENAKTLHDEVQINTVQPG